MRGVGLPRGTATRPLPRLQRDLLLSVDEWSIFCLTGSVESSDSTDRREDCQRCNANIAGLISRSVHFISLVMREIHNRANYD